MKENANPSEWYFSSDEYSPNLTVENWSALLKNPEIFNENSRFVMKCIVENGGQSTCQELAEHFGKTETFYQNVVKRLAKRIQLKTGCTLTYANNDGKYWYDSILFLKKRDEISGTWIWKMRDELKEAWEIFQPSQTPIIPSYTESDFLNEVYLSPQQYHTLTSLWKRKKNIILQGSTGVGKTFSAKRLAYAMMGKKDDSQIEFVQFHQSYSYEEFIMGYRPDRKGKLTLKEGIFKNNKGES